MTGNIAWNNHHKATLEQHRVKNSGTYPQRLHPKLVEARRKIEDLKMAKELGLDDDDKLFCGRTTSV